jgi:glycosyltransferase involved in cell wall biosynthesis
MKISIIGPGIMPIPPVGWGAVESLIWDYKVELEKLGMEIQIVNNPDPLSIVNEVNSFQPDFVHLQYDDFAHVLGAIECEKKAVTSHYGYIEQFEKHPEYNHILNNFIHGDFFIFCLSDGIANTYRRLGVKESRIFICPNGARKDLFRFSELPLYPEKSIYLAKIDYRKRQHLFQSISSVDFVGNHHDQRFNSGLPNYLGEWNKETLYHNLTDYSNLVLLSDGEADPLVTKEALMCGLGLVLSEFAVANLDLSLPFIDVIPEEKIEDLEYVENVILANRIKSLENRNQIRSYAVSEFSWERIVPKYIQKIEAVRLISK